MAFQQSDSHFVIFPFMAQGHTLPLLDLSKALSLQQIKVTIITTPSNAKFIAKYVENYPYVCLIEIPFPSIDGLPDGCENTSQLPSMEFFYHFLHATKKLQKPFQQVLQTLMESEIPPICVISDFFLWWSLQVCQEFNVPRLVFHGMSVLPMAITKAVWFHAPHLEAKSVSDPLHLPGMDNIPFTLTASDLPPETINAPNPDNPLTQCISEVGEADANSWGVIINSFEEIEQSYIQAFESFYVKGAKAWCLGPLFLYDKMEDHNKAVTKTHSSKTSQWLNQQVPGSVIYVSFGTQANVSDAQLDEVADGLESSGFAFLWVVRSKTWALSTSIEKKIEGRGLIVRDWVDQKQILSHRAIAGVLSHCGWNSVLESISAGVPILCWPMIAEQSLNAKFIVDGLEVGLSLGKPQNPGPEVPISKEMICEGVRELMGGEKGRNARERAQALGRVARRAMLDGGSSQQNLKELINQLCSR